MMDNVYNRNIFLGFSKISSTFGSMLEIPDIFWGDLSDPVFLGGTEQMLGPNLCIRKKSEIMQKW